MLYGSLYKPGSPVGLDSPTVMFEDLYKVKGMGKKNSNAFTRVMVVDSLEPRSKNMHNKAETKEKKTVLSLMALPLRLCFSWAPVFVKKTDWPPTIETLSPPPNFKTKA